MQLLCIENVQLSIAAVPTVQFNEWYAPMPRLKWVAARKATFT